MILHWMAYAALCGALFGLAAACIDRIFADWRHARRGVWLTAMIASTVVPFAVPLRSSQDAPPASPAGIVSAPAAAVGEAALESRSIDIIVLSVWGTASLLFIAVLGLAHQRTALALRRCHKGIIAGRPAFISRDFGPAVVGVLRPHIVVPSWALALDQSEQDLIVTHELEHARSGDPLVSLVGVCMVAALPWNVALWWQLSRLRLAIELDCDARVIARDSGDALRYSQLLLSVGERAQAARHAVLAMSHSRSTLARRFDALVARDAVRPRKVVALVLLGLGTVASVAFVPPPDVSAIVAQMLPAHSTLTPVAAPTFAGSVERAATPALAATPVPSSAIQPRATGPRSAARRQRAPSADVRSLPPVSVVPSNVGRAPFDSVVVARAKLPAIFARRAGGMIMAVPSGAGRRGGERATLSVAGDSNRVIRATSVPGGTAVLRPRPASSRPPQ